MRIATASLSKINIHVCLNDVDSALKSTPIWLSLLCILYTILVQYKTLADSSARVPKSKGIFVVQTRGYI